ncbi:MAG: MaoC family dehydratase N-terminal domain-containing protein [Candidatus Rokubacteria bacterium]|nr:MaoC family dehydratase N-terminal domain-containing protein [Candidatus Rokubacteria bacterium]
MKLPPELAGRGVGPVVHEVDARWLMAFAAGLGETAPGYLDTTRPDGVLAHPLFPVCYEWPAALRLRADLPDEVAVRGVHASHDVRLERLPRAGDRLATTARVTRVVPRAPGALVLTRFTTLDASDRVVSTTDYGTLYLGIECEAWGEAPAVGATPEIGDGVRWSEPVPAPATLGHVYTECARIWNPIHTDRAVALAAGLPDVILHGTATLGLAVSAVVRREAGGDPRRVRRLAGRFGAMVRLPSTLTVEGLGTRDGGEGRWVGFRVQTGEGRPAVRDGRVLLAR